MPFLRRSLACLFALTGLTSLHAAWEPGPWGWLWRESATPQWAWSPDLGWLWHPERAAVDRDWSYSARLEGWFWCAVGAEATPLHLYAPEEGAWFAAVGGDEDLGTFYDQAFGRWTTGLDLRAERRARRTLATLSLPQKLQQMLLLGEKAATPETLAQRSVGGVLFLPSEPADSATTVETWAARSDALQQAARETTAGGIPLLLATDAVHGLTNVRDAVILPHNLSLAASADPEILAAAGDLTAEACAAAGINWALGPCVAVARDLRWGRSYESFGENPERALLAADWIRALQAERADQLRVAACAKHFVADGGTAFGTSTIGQLDQGDAQIDRATLDRLHLPPYAAAIDAGTLTIMASFSSWNGTKVHASRGLLTDVLRGELGFRGLVVSDLGGIWQLMPDSTNTREAVRLAINAGVDMAMEGGDRADAFLADLESLVQSGEVPAARIDEAVRRILRVKHRLGLFEQAASDGAARSRFGGEAQQAVGRRLAAAGAVLLKNEGALLPLAPGARIVVCGPAADDPGRLCGGWSLAWGGFSGRLTRAGTVYEALRSSASEPGLVTLDPTAENLTGADIVVCVAGEAPYAEWIGDRSNLRFSGADGTALNRASRSGKPTLLVFVGGRPLELGTNSDRLAGLVFAGLPGTEVEGLVELLRGQRAWTATLPCSWPRTSAQLPLNAGQEPYDPLFAYGAGILGTAR